MRDKWNFVLMVYGELSRHIIMIGQLLVVKLYVDSWAILPQVTLLDHTLLYKMHVIDAISKSIQEWSHILLHILAKELNQYIYIMWNVLDQSQNYLIATIGLTFMKLKTYILRVLVLVFGVKHVSTLIVYTSNTAFWDKYECIMIHTLYNALNSS